MNITNNIANLHNIPLIAFETTLLAATKAAAGITLPSFRSGINVKNKLDEGFDPVTEADHNAELVIRQVIEEAFPDHAIIGEEQETKHTNSAFSWIIDPIDGTRSFITGVPVWGTLIGVAYEGKMFAGIMTQPFIGETFISVNGKSRYFRSGEDEKILRTSNIKTLAQARMLTTTPALFEGEKRLAYNKLEQQVRLPRYGCDCYAYCLLASGDVDLVVEAGLNIYDIAALIPIIKNAGGTITNFDGGPADNGGDIIAAATPELHKVAMEIMAPKK